MGYDSLVLHQDETPDCSSHISDTSSRNPKDILFLQTFFANENTEASQKPFSIDPPSAGTIANLSNLESYELLNTPTPQPLLIGNSDTPTSLALSSFYDQHPLCPEPTLKASVKFRVDQLKKLLNEEVSGKKTILSDLQSNYFFLYDKIICQFE